MKIDLIFKCSVRDLNVRLVLKYTFKVVSTGVSLYVLKLIMQI